MPSCTHCGALHEDAATFCPSCGTPRESGPPAGTRQPVGDSGYGYVRVGPTILPHWLLWVLAALIVAGGATAIVLSSSDGSSDEETIGALSSTSPTPDPSLGSPPPTDIYSTPPTYTETQPPTDYPSPTPSDLSPSPDNASAVVEEYYRDINAGDFSAAWDLGGKNIGGSSYSRWKSGFGTTVNIELSAVNDGSSGQVSAVLRATQTDGSVRVYQGTYTVSDGAIVSADISQR
ncbi:zinc-ribbon domain-containing protein [Streptomyces platensis]|uniref:zinc ribbon domain-containing protein n=1 Tax=Streptomyces platensis TaxID=58346 RepID=UPI003C2C1743